MGLDVYVGTLTRYYSGDWELITQRVGRELGLTVEVVRQDDHSEALTDPNEIRPMIEHWQSSIGPALGIDARWDEADVQPYFTDKPDWDGYWGMLFLAGAVANPTLAVPDVWPDHPERRPLVQITHKRHGLLRRKGPPESGSRFWCLRVPTVWLPWEFDGMWHGRFPSGETLTVGSVSELNTQLRMLATDLGASDDTLTVWEEAIGQPLGEEIIVDGQVLERFERSAPLEAGRRGLAMFIRLAALAAEHRLPLRLDY